MILERRIQSRFTNMYCLDPVHSSRAHSGTRRSVGAVYLSKLSGEARGLLPGCNRPIIHHGRCDQLTRIAKRAGLLRANRSRSDRRLQGSAYILNIYPAFPVRHIVGVDVAFIGVRSRVGVRL